MDLGQPFAVCILVVVPSSFRDNIIANPAPALAALGALVAALVTLITFTFNFRATIRNQQDTQFYEALKRFGDQGSPALRSSAAGLLAKMALRKNLFRRPYFTTALDQLTYGLLIETDQIVLAAVGKAINQLGAHEPHIVIEELRAVNLRLQEDVVTLLGRLFFLRGAKHAKDWQSYWDAGPLLLPFTAADVKTLIEVPENSQTFANSIEYASQRYEPLSPEKTVKLKKDVGDRLRLTGRRLLENCRLMNSVAYAIIPYLSSSGEKMTRTGYKKFRRAPLLKRYRRHELTLNRVFLPAISLHHRFINKVNFSHAVLVGADFSNSVVLNSSFYEAYLRGADFGGALLKSSKVGKTFSGWRMKSPTTFVTAQLQDVDFREAEFFKTMMSGADMTRAKMYGASIVVDDTWDWKDTNWWKADYDRGESATLDSAAANLTTNDSLRLLYSQHGEHVPTDANEVHSSVREFSRAQQVDVKQ